MASGMKILYASAEVVPFAKTGGLADVAGALPRVLAEEGHDVRIIMPRYSSIDAEKFNLREVVAPFNIPHGHDTLQISIEQSDAIPGVQTYFIRNDYLYNRPTLYGQPDDDHRFIAYCRGILEACKQLNWMPDVINCNDWHTGLVPVYLKTLYADDPAFARIGTLYTIHNLAYQSPFPPQTMELAGLPWELFTWDKLDFYGKLNFMKAGLVFADRLSTVSETYAQEIQTPAYGEGLEGVLAYRSADLYGILNGIDYEVWSPAIDGYIAEHFSSNDMGGKAACKADLRNMMKLPQRDAPLFGIVSRLSWQKGFDFVEAVLPELLEQTDSQVVILGTGEEHFEKMLIDLAKRFPEQLALAMKFDDGLAHRIYAGCDMFLMPSHYEPCGLGQMISLAYGTIPIVRATGGLADTISEFKMSLRSKGNGFVFAGDDPDDFRAAIQRAMKCYTSKQDCWHKVMENAMASYFPWQHSAKKYVKVYQEAMKRVKGHARLVAIA